MFYVYGHYRKDTGEIFYVGKGRGDRYLHKHPALRSKFWSNYTKKYEWYADIIAHFDDEQAALRFECAAIKVFGRRDIGTGILVNHTNGGDGVSGRVVTEETRRKLSVSQKGKKRPSLPDDQKKKISDSMKGKPKNNYRQNYRHSEETKERIRKAHYENNAKKREEGYDFGASIRGQKRSEETKRKLREAWVRRRAREKAS